MIKRLIVLFGFILIFLLVSCNEVNYLSIEGYVLSNTFLDNESLFISVKKDNDIHLTSNIINNSSDNKYETWFGSELDRENKLIVVGTKKFEVYVNFESVKSIKSMIIKTNEEVSINDIIIEKEKETKVDVECKTHDTYTNIYTHPELCVDCTRLVTIEILTLIDEDGVSYEATNRKKFTIIPTYDLIDIDESKEFITFNRDYEFISLVDNYTKEEIISDTYELGGIAITLDYYVKYNDVRIRCKRYINGFVNSYNNKKELYFNNYQVF